MHSTVAPSVVITGTSRSLGRLMRGAALSAALLVATSACAHQTQRERHGALEVVTVRLAYNNAHVLRIDERSVLVDTGTEADAAELDRRLRDAGIDPSELAAIVLTHGHADHAGGAKWFRDRYDVPIIAGAGDRELLAGGHNDRLCPTDRQGRKRHAVHQAATFAPVTVDHPISEPTDLSALVGVAATVAPLPGHTEGSLVLVVGELAFVGDLFRGSLVGASAERHFYMCDLADNDVDVETLLSDLAPRATSFYVGHFGPLEREAVRARWP
jgi:glyoxylase-like metal-dependent hydrolase (beta-lactamase superfamily II)